MDAEYDFTVDTENFAGLKEFVDELHQESKKFIPIVDAGVAYRPN
jgi:alpha-glucosidase (family GH31 glycosyl hydrolase)